MTVDSGAKRPHAQNGPSSRRDALKQLGALLAGCALPFEVLKAAEVSAHTQQDIPPTSMTRRELLLLEAVADTLLPRTSTPGALDADVPRMVLILLSGWADEATSERYRNTLKTIEQQASRLHTRDFVKCSKNQQLQLLQDIDAAAYADGDLSGYVSLKRLLLFTFFSSEVGATQVLRFDSIPGAYTACADGTDADRAWFETGFAYDL